MTNELVFTKRAVSSGKGYLVWIPKNIVDFLALNENSYVEVKIKKLAKANEAEKTHLTFVKKVAKSGRGYLLWIQKDITDYLSIDENSYCEMKIRLLGEKNA